MADPHVVAVSASRRDGSHTRAATRHALSAAADVGATTDFVDLGTVDLPLYHPDRDDRGDAPDLVRRVRTADGVVLGSPVYHSSYSSTFKNFHDYCGHDEFEDTAVGLLAVAGGSSYASTLDHMRITVRGVHGLVIPHQVGIPGAHGKFDGDDLVDDDVADRVSTLGREVARYASTVAQVEG